MSDQPKPGVIGSLPRSRPHRRSDKRPAPATAATSEPAVPVTAPTTQSRAAKPKRKPAAAKPTAAAAKPRATSARPKAAPSPRVAPSPRAAPSPHVAPNPQAAPSPQVAPSPSATSAPKAPAEAPPSPGPLETAVQAAAELTEIGLHAGARALRRAVSRLPRP